MTRVFVAALALLFAVGTTAYADDDDVSAEAKAGIEKTLAEMGCTMDEHDMEADDGGYELDDVECKDGSYDMTLDKDFKVTDKEKED
jgi:hypothetical protein